MEDFNLTNLEKDIQTLKYLMEIIKFISDRHKFKPIITLNDLCVELTGNELEHFFDIEVK